MKQYNVIVPIKTDTFGEAEMKDCLSVLKSSDIRRILLIVEPFKGEIYPRLADDIAYFTENGIEVTVWMGETLGHGAALAGQTLKSTPFTPIVNPNGEGAVFAFCPLDPDFQKFFLDNVRAIVRAGARSILLDDDFRLSNRSYGIGCGCFRHRERISRRLGRDIGSNELAAAVLHGKANPVREAWFGAQGDSMREFSAMIRQTVDELDPTVRVGICAGQSIWDADGLSASELSQILAGGTRPFIRLCGGPYWAWRHNPEMSGVFEITSMARSYCTDRNIEIVAEGDVYPRPRYNCPSSYLELFDAFIRADGSYSGNMKYMADYYSDPKYETGYFKRHEKNLPAMLRLQNLFENGKRDGVRVYEFREKLIRAELPEDGYDTGVLSCVPYPHGGCMLGNCGIPTTYEGEGICGLAWGENARYLDDDAISHGLILDATAAKILTERGVDVGLGRIGDFLRISPTLEYFGTNTVMIDEGRIRYLDADLVDGVKIDSYIDVSEKRYPLSYSYTNGNGQSFLVFLFDSFELPRNSGWLFSYARQKQLYDAIEHFCGKRLPAYIDGEPFMYQLMKRDGDVATVGFFNCFADTAVEPLVKLGDGWRLIGSENVEAKKVDEGVKLSDIPAFGYAVIRMVCQNI